MSDYDTDTLTRSEHQAALRRRVRGGERVNDQVDWENVIEEIESVGRSEVKGVRSALMQALLHRFTAGVWPNAPYVDRWRAEEVQAPGDAADDFTESMREKIDVAKICHRALRAMPATIDGWKAGPALQECPVTLDELLGKAWRAGHCRRSIAPAAGPAAIRERRRWRTTIRSLVREW